MKKVVLNLATFFSMLSMLSLIGYGVVACSEITSRVAPDAAKAINRYCEEPLAERQTLRSTVNGMIAPNSVKITCAGDPQ